MSITLVIVALVALLSSVQSASLSSTPKFAKSTFNDMSVGNEPDVAKIFDAVSLGCTGFIRDGKKCDPGNSVNAQISEDPAGSGDKVMEVNFKKYEYASNSGVQFYTKYDFLENEAMLEYSVYFPDGFDWVHGGKLPGLHGGDMHCTGGDKSNGDNCFSTRLMWREGGKGEAYMYVPLKNQEDAYCQRCAWEGQTANSCDSIRGESYCLFERGSFTFGQGKWNKVRQYIKLNNPGQHNGVFELFINGQRVQSADNVLYRMTNDIKMAGLLFSTFFGGDSSYYAPKGQERIFFKDFSIYG